MKKLVHLTIKGIVQGVGYRAFAADEAEQLGLEGWVRNRRDGSVEAVAFGETAKIERLISVFRSGPPSARVASVDVTDAEPSALGLRPAGQKFAMLSTV
jgi:acylphosphatase